MQDATKNMFPCQKLKFIILLRGPLLPQSHPTGYFSASYIDTFKTPINSSEMATFPSRRKMQSREQIIFNCCVQILPLIIRHCHLCQLVRYPPRVTVLSPVFYKFFTITFIAFQLLPLFQAMLENFYDSINAVRRAGLSPNASGVLVRNPPFPPIVRP